MQLGGHWSAEGMLQIDCTSGCLQFTVNTPSLMHLTLSGLIESGELGIGCCAFWALQGPSRFNSDSLGFGPLDETFFAEPGTYELFGSFGGFVGGHPGEDPHMVGSESFSLAATFTSIPEPRWAFVAVLFGLLWPLVRHRWCIWSPNMLDPQYQGVGCRFPVW